MSDICHIDGNPCIHADWHCSVCDINERYKLGYIIKLKEENNMATKKKTEEPLVTPSLKVEKKMTKKLVVINDTMMTFLDLLNNEDGISLIKALCDYANGKEVNVDDLYEDVAVVYEYFTSESCPVNVFMEVKE